MKYRVFISATKKDLSKQRAFVSEQLRQADIEVNRMEEWPADTENPAHLSALRTKNCHFCVALVAFQRGTIAALDPAGRSITQIEIDAAHRNGARVLYFLLEDTPSNRARWPSEFNRIDDPKVVDWRNSLQKEQTCQFFDAGDGQSGMPNVLPAIMRQIFTWEARRRRFLISIIVALALCMLLPALALCESSTFQHWSLSRLVSLYDSVVFQHARDGNYKIARLVDGRSVPFPFFYGPT